MKSIIIPEKKSIIIPAKYNFIREHIADVKSFEFGGKSLLQVKHNLPNTEILNGLGFSIPSPILSQYEFPKVKGKFTAFEHQKTTAAFIIDNKKCFVFNELGMGKTESMLYAADFLIREGSVSKVLIVSPLSTIERVWADSLFSTFHWLSYEVLHGTSAKRKESLANKNVDCYIVNYDGLKVLEAELSKRDDIGLIMYDEAAILRTGDTKLYEVVKKLAKPHVRLVLATATPVPNGPEGAWALAKLVNPNGVPKYFGAWKRQVMHQISQFTYVPMKDSHLKVKEALQPAILFEKSMCLDLPPCTIQKRECELSTEQKAMMKQMRKDMQAELESGETINSVNSADKILKCLQIVAGSVKNPETGEYHDLDCKNRMNTLIEVIEESSKKIIVFADFTGSLRMITKELKKRKIDAEYVDGSVSAATRNDIFHRFQNSKSIKVLVCNSRTTSHGLTLTAANTVCWWVPPYSLERFLQANGRVDRPSQDTNTSIVLLGSSAFEWQIYDKLIERNENLNNVLDLYKKICE